MSALADLTRLAERVAGGGDPATGPELMRLAELVEGEAKVAYPYMEGDVVVLGPETFVSRDGHVLSWKGQNYEVQGARPLTGEALGQVAELVAHCDIRVLHAGGEFVPVRLKAVLDLYDAAEHEGALGTDARVALGMRAMREKREGKVGVDSRPDECTCGTVIGRRAFASDPVCPVHGEGKS